MNKSLEEQAFWDSVCLAAIPPMMIEGFLPKGTGPRSLALTVAGVADELLIQRRQGGTVSVASPDAA